MPGADHRLAASSDARCAGGTPSVLRPCQPAPASRHSRPNVTRRPTGPPAQRSHGRSAVPAPHPRRAHRGRARRGPPRAARLRLGDAPGARARGRRGRRRAVPARLRAGARGARRPQPRRRGGGGMSAATAIITGASRGLGFALADALAQRGWRLVIDARNADELEAARVRLAQHGAEVLAIPGDVADAWHRGRLLWLAGERIDLLVNNASTLGASPLPALADLPLEVLERTLRVNVVAPLALVQLALPRMAAGGRIINVTSDAAVEAYEGWGGYGLSKAALEQLTRVLAVERPDLRVYAVDPGDMNTRMHQEAFPGEDISDRPPPSESVPGLLALVEGDVRSGRHRAADLAAALHA